MPPDVSHLARVRRAFAAVFVFVVRTHKAERDDRIKKNNNHKKTHNAHTAQYIQTQHKRTHTHTIDLYDYIMFNVPFFPIFTHDLYASRPTHMECLSKWFLINQLQPTMHTQCIYSPRSVWQIKSESPSGSIAGQTHKTKYKHRNKSLKSMRSEQRR